MEDIRQAVELARTKEPVRYGKRVTAPFSRPKIDFTAPEESPLDLKEVELNDAWLTGERIVSHNAKDPRARAYDLLRT